MKIDNNKESLVDKKGIDALEKYRAVLI